MACPWICFVTVLSKLGRHDSVSALQALRRASTPSDTQRGGEAGARRVAYPSISGVTRVRGGRPAGLGSTREIDPAMCGVRERPTVLRVAIGCNAAPFAFSCARTRSVALQVEARSTCVVRLLPEDCPIRRRYGPVGDRERARRRAGYWLARPSIPRMSKVAHALSQLVGASFAFCMRATAKVIAGDVANALNLVRPVCQRNETALATAHRTTGTNRACRVGVANGLGALRRATSIDAGVANGA
jgi:hypothetical protein